MKILHTSDWHLGASDGDRSLIEDQRFFIDRICEVVKDQGIEAVIIAGDVYDRSVASAEAIRLYDYAMTRLCRDLGVTAAVVAGNHDSAERLSSCSDLLSSAGLYISGSLGDEITRVSFPDADIYLFPWITEEKVRSIYPEKKEEIVSLEAAYRVVADMIREGLDKDKRNIIVSHAFITDSETSVSDRAAEIGFAAQVSADVFAGFDYAALGHIHKPQDVSDTVRYSGTPMPYSFGKEEKQQKSVTVIDTSDMSREIIPLPLLHARTTLTGTLDELLQAGEESDIHVSDEIRNGYVRLEVTDTYVGLEALSRLRRVYPCLLEVQGKSYEGENSTVTLTVEELEKLESDPVEIFRHYCREEMDMEPDDHLVQLFMEAAGTEEAEQA